MNCEQATEFVSALFDGERIPREAAEHIGGCTACGMRMHDYALMGAELRRSASYMRTDTQQTPARGEREALFLKFWRQGLESMRIPRLAFGLMVAFFLALSIGSIGFALTHAKVGDRWFQYTLKGRDGKDIVRATVPTNPKGNPYYETDAGMSYAEGVVWFHIRVLDKVGDAEKILVKTLWVPRGAEFNIVKIKEEPEREFLCLPGEDLKIPVAGYGSLKLDGHFEAVLPENVRSGLYPEDDKLRIYPPVALIRGKEMLSKADFGGGESSATDEYFAFGAPGDGWYIFSPKRIEGWVQGTISANQIEFTLNGHHHFLLAGMPIAFGSLPVWVKHYESISEADPFSEYGKDVKREYGELAFGKLKNLAGQK